MSAEEKNQNEYNDLSQLEASLAALVPRADRLNRDRLMFLAGQAAAEARLGQVSAVPVQPSRRAGWFWPAATATMTALAASLLVTLAVRPVPQATGPIAKGSTSLPAVSEQPAVAVAREPIKSEAMVELTAIEPALPDWLVWALFSAPPAETKPESSYLEVRNQVLLHGWERSNLPLYASSATTRVDDQPIPSCGELNRWLKQEGVERALRRLSAPNSRNALGAKS